ncbi:MAG: CbiX/SirB N-terminal domain-containing protein [Planctomycetota bacterium]
MLILMAHGSPDPRWRASVEMLVTSVAAELGPGRVRLAYLACAPTLPDVAAEAARGGAQVIRVLPLFLAFPGHVERDIRPLVAQVRQAHYPVEVELLPPLGQHPLFRELLQRIAAEEPE